MTNDRNPRSATFRRSPPNNSTRSLIQASDNVPPLGDQKDHPRQLNPNLQAIKGFLTSCIGPVQKAENHTTSDGTQPPALWDLHLDSLQTLRQVEINTNLNQQLSDLAKEKIHNPGDESVQEKNVLLSVDLLRLVKRAVARMAFWGRTIVRWCKKTSTTQSVAVADGYLCLDIKSIEASSASVHMKENLLLAAKMFPEIAVFEFKSLQLDTEEQIQALVDVANEATFGWIRCDPGKCKKSHFVGGYPQTTCAPMGFDAQSNLPFQYPKCQVEAREEKRDREEAEEPCPPKPLSACSKVEVHAQHVFQQVWAEAVARDATFLIIQCGNREIIGLRMLG
ncbi:hypothetical protein PLEOSDRAFT_1102425 [Pleurotus ostreatus PC15]|uniref:Uncharacterized protein n=1 Tax=Pleurotus ostreatus (strain PC15) TaxID=1137138 RepID=A0A067NWU1_PLEO1|nr:hypothetical protein PLEOSDRAFT_1102425 [Pleurotus ostreatus PC15]